MLSLIVFLPLLGMVAVLLAPARPEISRTIALATAGLTLLLTVVLWLGFEPGGGYQFVDRLPWITPLGVGYAVGVDGISLPLVALTALLFAAALLASWNEERRVREYYAWFLFMEMACLGVFAAMDLFLFYIFWDLTLVGMYFVIALWGHEGAKGAALKFFLYTLVGSLALLLGIIGLYLAAEPLTMDMVALSELRPLAQGGPLATVVFFALLVGLGIKVPVVPVHTWLPPAHAEAPAPGSAILAGIMLKMGAYGLIRIGLGMLPETFAYFAPLVVVIGVVSVIYGALVALAQTDLKRLIAYTSVNHMGYVILAIGAAAWVAGDTSLQARTLAINGAVLQMVSHGLITGSLFLLAGVLWHRAYSFDLDGFGGLARTMPIYAGAFGFAAFASLGLPGLSGFVAEFQIFVGAFGVSPWAAGLALPGIVITAGLLLWTLMRLFMGPLPGRWEALTDMDWSERGAIFPLLV
ncbi:MAG: NADH-quinone oxidoreductase subunit M, partial [Candidatus Competibacteraceae bacterium]|nr:NADH-quinone oxidoreductase subunit M [Candidatus Competibacteraceae bacterium]